MELQQDIVDLTINNDDDCLFPTEPSEMVNSLLKMDGTEGNKETTKQNHEDDTLSIYGSEDGEIATDEEEEKEEESKKIIFERIWPNFRKKPRKATFQSAAFNVYSFDHEQKKMNKLLSQITFTSNEEKEKINYLNYSPPTIDESSSNM